MKKVLLSSITLFLFSASIMMFQISCQKEANARISESPTRIVFAKGNGSTLEIWYCNSDGSGMNELNITTTFDKIYRVIETPVDNKIFFTARETSTVNPNLYSCNLDGSNVQKLTNETSLGAWLGSW